MTYSVVDLFSGCGGLSLGFEAAGFEVLGGNDFDDDSMDSFALNHPDAKVWRGDVANLSSGEVLSDVGLPKGELDVLVGGPPCQGFSRNRARRHIAGKFMDDPRNYLFLEFLRFVDDLQPRVVVIENVADMLIKEDGKFKREIFSRLDSMGYTAAADVLNAADFGVPQRRRRAFIVAGRGQRVALPQATHAKKEDVGQLLPLPKWLTIWDAIGDLPSLQEGEGSSPSGYADEPFTNFQKERRKDCAEVTDHVAWRLSAKQRERLSHLSEGDTLKKLPPHLAPKSGYGSAYRRMARDIPALTITTWLYHPGSGMYYHPVDPRTITLREAARLQSFDDDVRFVGKKISRCRQVGNAVPPVLAKAIAETVATHL